MPKYFLNFENLPQKTNKNKKVGYSLYLPYFVFLL